MTIEVATSTRNTREAPETVALLVADLRAGPTARVGGLSLDHVRVLAESEGEWPPLVVRAADHTVIDGLHRLRAAKLLGLRRVPCVLFEGSNEDAFLESVRRNIGHGRPLSLRERSAAVERVLSIHGDWSDRRIAQCCGLSPTTVGNIRARQPLEQGEVSLMRRGRDGRLRRLPNPPKDEAASLDGDTSDTKRRSIPRSMQGHGPVIAPVRSLHQSRHESPSTFAAPRPERISDYGQASWDSEPAVLIEDHETDFAAWFSRTDPGDEWSTLIDGVPVSRLYEIVDEARRRAAKWTQIATAIERDIALRIVSSREPASA